MQNMSTTIHHVWPLHRKMYVYYNDLYRPKCRTVKNKKQSITNLNHWHCVIGLVNKILFIIMLHQRTLTGFGSKGNWFLNCTTWPSHELQNNIIVIISELFLSFQCPDLAEMLSKITRKWLKFCLWQENKFPHILKSTSYNIRNSLKRMHFLCTISC